MSANTPRAPRVEDEKLLDKITAGLIKEHDVTLDDFAHAPSWDSKVGRASIAAVLNLRPATLGRLIAAFPDAGLRGCHGFEFLSAYNTGLVSLEMIAATVIMARMKHQLGAPGGGIGFFESYNRVILTH